MPHKLIYNWEEIQKFYNEGNSLKACQEKFGFGSSAATKAIKANRLVLRSHEEAFNLKRKNFIEETNNLFSPTTLKGDIACTIFDLRALEKGIIISKPNIECVYDRIADIDGNLYKVQIKYAGSEIDENLLIGKISKSCKNVKVPYTEKDIDIIVLYSPKNNKCYWLPKEIWLNKKMISLRLKESKNNYVESLFAENYEW